MFSSQGNETKKIEKEFSTIEKDLMNDLLNSGESKKENSNILSPNTNGISSSLIVNDYSAKLFCDIKNAIIAKILTKDLDDIIKDVIRSQLKPTEREKKIYKEILEQVGSQYIPENHKEWIQKILLSPLIAGIEFEIERMAILKVEIHKAVKEAKTMEGKS